MVSSVTDDGIDLIQIFIRKKNADKSHMTVIRNGPIIIGVTATNGE